MKVAIQGVKASFHDVAARKYFNAEPIEIVECATFKRLCEALRDGDATLALMAIENSIAGSILTNFTLLDQFRFRIVGETYLRIELHLMALKNQNISDIRVAMSHPIALSQCEEFFSAHPMMKMLEASDTADSAQYISKNNIMGHAAIASRLAAEIYQLKILAEGIETNKANYTRFLVLSRPNDSRWSSKGRVNKASLCFETQNTPGSLCKVLDVLWKNNINLSKIQSVPLLGKPYQYSIHLDAEWPIGVDFTATYESLKPVAINLRSFGEYLSGEKPRS